VQILWKQISATHLLLFISFWSWLGFCR